MITATHLHAMLIHFPIALLLVAFLSELIAAIFKSEFYKKVSLLLLILGTIGVIAAFLSGGSAGVGIEEGPLKIPMELHEQAANFSIWMACIAATFHTTIYFLNYKSAVTKAIGIVLFAVLIAAISRTAYLGGQLVYSHGAGVELVLPDFQNTSENN
jgi:uncharacterized membrane protein